MTSEDVQASVEAGQALVPMLRDVGVDLRFRVVPSAVLANLVNASNFDIEVQRVTNPAPDIHMGDYGPVSADEPTWHQAGPGGRTLLPFEEQMAVLMDEARFTTDATRRGEIFYELLRLSTENVYTVGLYESRRGIAVNKRLRNFPSDLPTYLYEWGIENMPWLAWAPAEEQIAPRFLDLIPTAEAYTGRAWGE